MDQHPGLSLEQPNQTWSLEKPTPLTAASSCYRSQIYTSTININPLIAASDPILSLATTLKTIEYPADKGKFLQDLAHEIRAFEHHAQIANYQASTITAARYILCNLLDEAIATAPWGQEHDWSNKNLLTMFHNENYNEEHFFAIIESALADATTNLHLIELLYLCFNFGFPAQHQCTAEKQNELLAISNKLYQIIGQHSQLISKNILIHETKSDQLVNFIPPPKSTEANPHKNIF